MIYLIGGPPKCGKTTLSKVLSISLNIPWISTDTLGSIGQAYTKQFSPRKFKELYPHTTKKSPVADITYTERTPGQIAKDYIAQANSTAEAIDIFCICEITNMHSCILEGYHITPELVASLNKKYGEENFKAVFLTKKDQEKFIEDIPKSTTPNDWILNRTKNPKTYKKIAEMISIYSEYFENECDKLNMKIFNMDQDFDSKIKEIVNYLK